MSQAKIPQEWRVARLDDQVEIDGTEYDVGVSLTVDSHKGRESVIEFEVVAISPYNWERAYDGVQKELERGAVPEGESLIFERDGECLIHNSDPDVENLYKLLCPITGDDTGLTTQIKQEAYQERYDYLFDRIEQLSDSIQASREDETVDDEEVEELEAEKQVACDEIDEVEWFLDAVRMDELRIQQLPTEYLDLYEMVLAVEDTMLTPREAEAYYYAVERKMNKTLVAELMNVSRQTVYNHVNNVAKKREEAEATLTFLREAEQARSVREDYRGVGM
jgi:predicted DNA-binding protein YlxM (UPF0122 family)/uncharacterized protein YdcH (DUF465 family)